MTQLSSFQPLSPISPQLPFLLGGTSPNRHYAADALLLPCAKGNRPTTSPPSFLLLSQTRSLPRRPSDAIASPPFANCADSRGIPTTRLFLLPSSDPGCPHSCCSLVLTGVQGQFLRRRGVARASRVVPLCRGETNVQRQRKKFFGGKTFTSFSSLSLFLYQRTIDTTCLSLPRSLHLRKTPLSLPLFLLYLYPDFFGVFLSLSLPLVPFVSDRLFFRTLAILFLSIP